MMNLLKLNFRFRFQVLTLVIAAWGCNYDAEFEQLNKELGSLNDRLEAMEGQVEGLTDLVSGIQDVQGRLGALETALDVLPVGPLATGVADLLERMAALELALGDLDPESGGLQGEIDALNASLQQLEEELALLLETNNVYPSDLVITSEAELDAILAFMEGRETLIVNGALLLGPNEYYGMAGRPGVDSPFTLALSEKIYAMTSRIIAVLGKKLDLGFANPGDIGGLDPDFGFFVSESIPVGAIQVMGVEGDVLFPELRSVNGAIYMEGIGGNVEMPKMNFVSTLTITESMYGDFSGPFVEGTSSAYFVGINGSVSLPSLNYVDQLNVFEVDGKVDVSNLKLVRKDLMVSLVGDFLGGGLEEIRGQMDLDYGGGYVFPLLQRVGNGIVLVDYGTENPNGAPTLRVDFPALEQLGSPISVRDEQLFGTTDNEFSNATYINILGFFSQNHYANGVVTPFSDQYGFAAPVAETVIVNGDKFYEMDQSVIRTDLYLSAPNADVVLTFSKTSFADLGYGDLLLEFNTLQAENLDYINGSLGLIGPSGGVGKELAVSFPRLETINGNSAPLLTINLFALSMPQYVETAAIPYLSYDLKQFTAATISHGKFTFLHLESLTLTALDSVFDLAVLDIGSSGVSAGVDPAILKELNITGLDCGASVMIGSNDPITGYDTAFDALENLTLGGVFNQVQVVGADGLTSVNTSGEITSWTFVDNNAVTTQNVAHIVGTCP